MKMFQVFCNDGKAIFVAAEDYTWDCDDPSILYFTVRQEDRLSRTVATFNWNNIFGIREME